jgi:carboxyl-terminal processing protease
MTKVLLLCIVVFLISCEKTQQAPLPPSDYSGSSFGSVFEAFWTGMNTRYAFWDVDTTNWANMYNVYKPKFDALGEIGSNTQASTFATAIGYMKLMTQGLQEGHYQIEKFTTNPDRDTIWPTYYRKLATDPNFNAYNKSRDSFFLKIVAGYLDQPIDTVTTITEGDNLSMLTGTIGDTVLYFHFSRCLLEHAYNNNTRAATLLNNFFDNLAKVSDNSSNLKGVIIDVRSNPGGKVADISFLIGRMITAQVLFGYTRIKIGNGRFDFAPWANAIVTPQWGLLTPVANKPIVVLADNWSQSCAEQMAMAIKSLPNGIFVGDKTWGAQGPFDSETSFSPQDFSGPFYITDSNYAFVYTSTVEFMYRNLVNYEGIGFTPDKVVPDSTEYRIMTTENGDLQLETALKVFN